MDNKTKQNLKKELSLHAHAIGLEPGAADSFITATLRSVQKSLKNKSTITSADLDRLVIKELKKYNSDLAYVYEIRDKII
jgi:hypothetical protein